MAKKFIVVIILIILVACIVPMILNKMASMAFEDPEDSSRQTLLKKAIMFETCLFMYESARKDAEKAIIYFPESNYYDFYLFNAASCAQKNKESEVAIHWYERFIEKFPNHKWTQEAKNNLNILKALNE